MITVFVRTDPNRLLKAIEEAIDTGNITTWEKSDKGSFTYTGDSAQWINTAWRVFSSPYFLYVNFAIAFRPWSPLTPSMIFEKACVGYYGN